MSGLPARTLAATAAQGAGLLLEAIAGRRLMGVVRGAAELVFEVAHAGGERSDGLGLVGDRLLLLGGDLQQGEQEGGHRRRRLRTQGCDVVRRMSQTGGHSANPWVGMNPRTGVRADMGARTPKAEAGR